VPLTVRRPRDNRSAAEAEVGISGIPLGPAATTGLKRADRARDRGDGLLWRRLDGSRFDAAVCPSDEGELNTTISPGDRFDLFDRHHSRSQETEDEGSPHGSATTFIPPTPDAARGDMKQLSETVLCDAERMEIDRDRHRLVSRIEWAGASSNTIKSDSRQPAKRRRPVATADLLDAVREKIAVLISVE